MNSPVMLSGIVGKVEVNPWVPIQSGRTSCTQKATTMLMATKITDIQGVLGFTATNGVPTVMGMTTSNFGVQLFRNLDVDERFLYVVKLVKHVHQLDQLDGVFG